MQNRQGSLRKGKRWGSWNNANEKCLQNGVTFRVRCEELLRVKILNRSDCSKVECCKGRHKEVSIPRFEEERKIKGHDEDICNAERMFGVFWGTERKAAVGEWNSTDVIWFDKCAFEWRDKDIDRQFVQQVYWNCGESERYDIWVV